MGQPIVGQRLNNSQDFYSGNSLIWNQFSHDDPDDIVAAVKEAIRQPAMLSQLASANSEFFDRHLSPASLAGQVVQALAAP
jgi:hypothetical protein